jgi:prepilin-type processing-associated H-X9-DG protein
MTSTLQKQLKFLGVATVLGGTLAWNCGVLRAQEGERGRPLGITAKRIPLTRDQAAKYFMALLDALEPGSNQQVKIGFGTVPEDSSLMSSFSRSSETEDILILLESMVAQRKQPEEVVRVQSEDAQSATVVVEKVAPSTESRPLVLVKEGDSWGVDVLATWARWNGLEGETKTAALAQVAEQGRRRREGKRRTSCQSNLKQISLGLLQYAYDHDEKLPPAKRWIDLVWPYIKTDQVFTCPSVLDPKGYGYAYNSKLSNKLLDRIPEPALVPAFYETTILQRSAYGMGENRAYRHMGGANYAFADGHVKWMAQEQSPSFNLQAPKGK